MDIAKFFAISSAKKSKDLREVVLKIFMENKQNKYFICLDREDYTLYLDEKEVLLQAGLKGEVKEVSESGKLTIFSVFISDKMVQTEARKRNRDYAVPVVWFSIYQIYIAVFVLIYRGK